MASNFKTVEEAKKTWCPWAVASHTDPRSGFRDGSNAKDATHPCIANACSQWQWAAPDEDHTEWARGQREKYPPDGRGFCGVAMARRGA